MNPLNQRRSLPISSSILIGSKLRVFSVTLLLLSVSLIAGRADALRDEIEASINRPVLESGQLFAEIQAFVESRLPQMPEGLDRVAFETQIEDWREAVLDDLIYRGELAKTWRTAESRVVWQEVLDAGEGYRIRKMVYEALPNMWVPAALYEPDSLEGNVPVVLNANGHDQLGMSADYKQLRCINLAKKGMLALNVEWFGRGQLNTAGFDHYRINRLDLCGVSGIAPHYLQLSRGLDVLLNHPNADPERVAVTGLSGGGWQTIFISALDPRVTLANPVAGYSSFKTRIRNLSDLGDSEQTPTDLATIVDYEQLTAMMAPRPLLLTYNAFDHCCFRADHALPPLLDSAGPVYSLFEMEENLAHHINVDPGTHNYEVDNRQAFYAFLGDHFFDEEESFDASEIPSESELKDPDEFQCVIPHGWLDFSSLALQVSQELPSEQFKIPADQGDAFDDWITEARERLREVIQFANFTPSNAVAIEEEEGAQVMAKYWQLQFAEWTVPVVELLPKEGEVSTTSIVVSDGGKAEKWGIDRRVVGEWAPGSCM